MGTDIHLFIERKVKGVWERVEIPEELMPDDRDYGLFGVLAGIRSEEYEGLFRERGIPEDTCYKEELGFEEYHSQTYAYVDEISRVDWDMFDDVGGYFGVFFEYVLPRLIDCGYLTELEKRDIRVCMCFDN